MRRLPRHTPLVAFGAGAFAIALWSWLHFGTPVVTRTVAFDNTYGNMKSLVVHVKVDSEPEQRLVASCDDKTCTFDLPLRNGKHQLALAVEVSGQRGRPATVTVDTTNLPTPARKNLPTPARK